MAKPRVPGTYMTYALDAQGNRTSSVKSLWRGSGKAKSLKQFSRELLAEGSSPHSNYARAWFHNKRVNTSKPPLGLGRTNGKKSKQANTPKKEK